MVRVALGVALKLGPPVGLVGFGNAGIEAIAPVVQVPEAAVHENDFAPRPEYEIGFSRQVAGVEPVAEAEGVDDAAQQGSTTSMNTFFSGYKAPGSPFFSSRFSASHTPIAREARARKLRS